MFHDASWNAWDFDFRPWTTYCKELAGRAERQAGLVMASTLPGRSVTLRLPPDLATTSVDDQADESYQLLELPPEILKRIEGSKDVFPSVCFPL